ncbi:MAG: hypothetical protein LBN11_03730 [Tannerella sp.]|jgi:hypothetical protein|nr:hypothetical protein [Tannerella sp.]
MTAIKDLEKQWKQYYEAVKAACNNYQSPKVSDSILDLVLWSLDFLNNHTNKIKLNSKIKDKAYHSYCLSDGKSARPANSEFFLNDEHSVTQLWKGNFVKLNQTDLQNVLYTAALAPCLARDLFDRNDKKSSATYFECFIGHLFSKKFGCNPAAQESFQIGNKSVTLPTDFLFKTDKQNYHLPVKTSTRERIIQAWSHQRILTEHTNGRFKGMFVIFAETKLDANNHEVIEICVPDQWLIYQKYLARIDKIYYFDIPEKYAQLQKAYSDLFDIRPIAEAFQ